MATAKWRPPSIPANPAARFNEKGCSPGWGGDAS